MIKLYSLSYHINIESKFLLETYIDFISFQMLTFVEGQIIVDR
jgi:hypothetical protein